MGPTFGRSKRDQPAAGKQSDAGEEVVSVPADASGRLPLNLRFFPGISSQNAGSCGLCIYKVVIPPGAAAAPHRQVKFKSAIWLLEGGGQTRYGEGPKKSVINEAGDFLFIPRDLPHQPVNLSQKEAAEVIVARNDASASETLVLHDPEE